MPTAGPVGNAKPNPNALGAAQAQRSSTATAPVARPTRQSATPPLASAAARKRARGGS